MNKQLFHEARRIQLVKLACATRLLVIAVQFIANICIPDDDAKVFVYPTSNLQNSIGDKIINLTLSGFVRWDAHYFMHIAKYGYTHENTLAFFPLYPLIVKIIATILSQFVVFINEDSLLLLTFISLNIYIFAKTTEALYNLSSCFLNEDLAYKASVLFCVNPATIFFVAPYSECLFCYLTFKSMLNCALMYGKSSVKFRKVLNFKSIISVIIPIGLSTCVRSNGILNIGFIVYFIVQTYVKHFSFQEKTIKQIMLSIQNIILIIFIIIFCMLPFGLVQLYDYSQFCTNFKHNLPNHLVDFINSNEYVLPGMVSHYKQSWCFQKIPLAYSYVQDHYWNVGFLRYFELKQIPNFMFAFPVVAFVIYNGIKFILTYKEYCLKLGIFNNLSTKNKAVYFPPQIFVFVVHAVVLTVFCFLCVHVQITTRMLCSSSPIVYWFAAYQFANVKEKNNIFIFNAQNKAQKFILFYFIFYCFFGIILFCNFLPWT